MSPTGPASPTVARWPTFNATLNDDGTGVLTIEGREHPLDAENIDAARAAVLERVRKTAVELERPVRLTSKDPDGEWELAVHPDGNVDELAANPTPEPSAAIAEPATPERPPDVDLARDLPTVPLARGAEPPPLTRSQRKWAGAAAPPRRSGRPIAVAVALAVLIGLAVVTALLATSGGPDTVVSEPDPAPARGISENVATDAIAAAQRKAKQRRVAAAERRTARRALQRRVAARQARERRAARRALQRRVAARQARERRAAARRAAARRATPTAPRPRVTPPPPPNAFAPPPPPPPPPPPTGQCGEFDLC